jgi:hypothetical protein
VDNLDSVSCKLRNYLSHIIIFGHFKVSVGTCQSMLESMSRSSSMGNSVSVTQKRMFENG